MAENIWGYRNPWETQEEERQRARLASSASVFAPPSLSLGSVPSVPGVSVPSVAPVRFAYPKQNETPVGPDSTNILDYNDPNILNSFADVFAKHEKSFAWGGAIGALSMIPDSIDLLYRGFLKPLGEGDMAAVGINALTNFSETTGIFGNAVKGFAFDGVRGLRRSTGASGEGRWNYDWGVQTGWWGTDFLVNTALEVVSDPVNWITLGGKALLADGSEALLKTVLKETAQTAVQKGSTTLAKEALDTTVKNVSKRAVSLWLNGKGKYRNIADAFDEAVKAESNPMTKIVASGYGKRVPRVGLTPEEMKMISDLAKADIAEAFDKSVYMGLRDIVNVGENVERNLARSAMYSNGLGLAWFGAKKGYEHMNSVVVRRVVATLTKAVGDMPDGYVPLTRMGTASSYAQAMWSKLKTKIDDPELAKVLGNLSGEVGIRTSVAEERALLMDILEKSSFGGKSEHGLQELQKTLDEFFMEKEGQTFQQYREFLKQYPTKSPAIEQYLNLLDAIDDRVTKYANLAETEQNIANLEMQHRVFTEIHTAINDLILPVGSARSGFKASFVNGAIEYEYFDDFMPGIQRTLTEMLPELLQKISALSPEYAVTLRETLDALVNAVPDMRPLESEFFSNRFERTIGSVRVAVRALMKDAEAVKALSPEDQRTLTALSGLLSNDKSSKRKIFEAIVHLSDAVPMEGVPKDLARLQYALISRGGFQDARLYSAIEKFFSVERRIAEDLRILSTSRQQVIVEKWAAMFQRADVEHITDVLRKHGTALREYTGMAEARKVATRIRTLLGFQATTSAKEGSHNTAYYEFHAKFAEYSEYATEQFENMSRDLSEAAKEFLDNPTDITLNKFHSSLNSFIGGLDSVETKVRDGFDGLGRRHGRADAYKTPEKPSAAQYGKQAGPDLPGSKAEPSTAKYGPTVEIPRASKESEEFLNKQRAGYRESPQARARVEELRAAFGSIMERSAKALDKTKPESSRVIRDIIRILNDHLDGADFLGLHFKNDGARFKHVAEFVKAQLLAEDIHIKDSFLDNVQIVFNRSLGITNYEKYSDAIIREAREASELRADIAARAVREAEMKAEGKVIKAKAESLGAPDITEVPFAINELDIDAYFDTLRNNLIVTRDKIYLKAGMVDVLSTYKSYLFKQSQVRSFYELLAIPQVASFANLVMKDGAERAALVALSEQSDAAGRAAKELLEFAEGYSASVFLVDLIEKDPILSRTAKSALLDVFQSHARTSFGEFKAFSGKKVQRMLQDIERQVKSALMTERLDQRTLVYSKKYAEFYKDLLEDIKKQGAAGLHDAGFDVRVAQRTFYRVLKGQVPDHMVPLFFDTEMTGLNDSAEFLQFGWTIGDGDFAQTLEGHSKVMPLDNVIRMLTGEDDLAKAKVAYALKFEDGTPDEPNLLITLFETLKGQEDNLGVDSLGRRKRFYIGGHNVKGFDFPKLAKRFASARSDLMSMRQSVSASDPQVREINKLIERLNAGYEWFRGHETFDTYAMLEDKVGKAAGKWFNFGDDQKSAVRDIIRRYIERRDINSKSFLDADGPDLRRTIQSVDGSIASAFKEVADRLVDVKAGFLLNPAVSLKISGEFRDLTSNIFETLGGIDTRNRDLFGTVMRIGEAPMLDEAGNIVLDPFGKPVMTNAWLDAAGKAIPPEQMDGVINVNQFFKNAQTVEMMADLSAKTYIDTDVIRAHFDVGDFENGEVASDFANALTDAGRRIDRYAQGVRNISALMPEFEAGNYKLINNNLWAFLKRYAPNSREFAIAKYLKLEHGDGISDYATALWLYYKVRRLAGAPGSGFGQEFIDVFDSSNVPIEMKHAYEMLEHPEVSRSTFGDVDEVIDPFYDISIADDTVFDKHFKYRNGMEHEAKGFDDFYETFRILQDDLGREVPDAAGVQNACYKFSDGIRSFRDAYHEAASMDANLKSASMPPHFVRDLTNALIRHQDAMGTASVYRVLTMAADSLAAGDASFVRHMYHNAAGVITFSQSMFSGEGDPMYRLFHAMIPKLEEAGVHVHQAPNRIWMYLDNSTESIAKWSALEPLKQAETPFDLAFPEYLTKHHPKVAKAIRDGLDGLNDLTGGRATGSLGIGFTATNLADVHVAAPDEIISKFIPTEYFQEQNFIHIGDDMMPVKASYFAQPRFNHSNLGASLDMKEIQPYISMNLYKNIISGAKLTIPRLDAKMKAKLSFFDNHIKVSHLLAEDGVTAKDLVAALKQERSLVAAAYVKDAKGKYKVMKFAINNEKDIQNAVAMDAVLMHQHIFTKAVQVLNDDIIDSNLINFWSKYVAGPMRVAMLSTLGFPARNLLDTGLKTMQFADMNPSMIKHTLETMKLYNRYVAIIRAMLSDKQLNDMFESTVGFVSPQRVAKFFELYPEQQMTQEMFTFLHSYMVNSYSGGIADAQLKMLIKRHVSKENESIALWNAMNPDKPPKAMLPGDTGYEPWQELLYEKNAWSNVIFSMNSNFEHIFRLSTFTWDIMHNGATFGEASASVLRTHFDYGTKSKAMRLLETVVPFSNFTVHNTMYWADLVQSRKWYGNLLMDVFRPIADQDGVAIEDLQNNRSLQNRILSGNLQIAENGLTLKLNPSFMDALQTASNPFGAGRRRLMSFLGLGASGIEALAGSDNAPSSATDWQTAIVQSIPLFGPVYQRMATGIANAQKTGSVMPGIMPSLFGRTAPAYGRSYGIPPKTPLMPRTSRLPLSPAKQRVGRKPFIRKTGNMTRTGILLSYGLLETTTVRNPHISSTVSNQYLDTGHVQNQIQVLLDQRKQSLN